MPADSRQIIVSWIMIEESDDMYGELQNPCPIWEISCWSAPTDYHQVGQWAQCCQVFCFFFFLQERSDYLIFMWRFLIYNCQELSFSTLYKPALCAATKHKCVLDSTRHTGVAPGILWTRQWIYMMGKDGNCVISILHPSKYKLLSLNIGLSESGI